MENGYDGRLEGKFSGMKLGLGHEPSSSSAAMAENPNDSLFQVMKAVEAAEATIKQQVEENNRLRIELQNRNLLIEKLKLDESMSERPISLQNPPERMKQDSDVSMAQNLTENRLEGGKMTNGTIKGQQIADSVGFSSPSTGSFSPRRLDGEHDQRLNSGQGLMPITELNHQNSLWKQDLGHKVQEHEEEIMLLRKHLADYSIKEAKIRNEKHVLEKRIAYMRLAFDQQQQDLVDAASKALSYRQDIIEENIRLTYALQDAQQERSTFVSSLLPLLAEYSLQPPVIDAQSIVSNVKVLFKHLQEKLLLTEIKLKESQYQLTPWRADVSQSNIATHSASHPIGTALTNSNTNGLELVPQPVYSQGKVPVHVPNADAQPAAELDLWVQQQPAGVSGVAQNLEHDDMGRYSPIPSSRASLAQDMPTQVIMSRGPRYGEEMANKQVTFRDPVTNTDMEDRDGEGNQNDREAQTNWSSGNPPYSTSMDDPSSSYSPFLPPVLEEPSSSFSEAADDDPLPAIEGLQIAGEAFPGRELQASGYSINGTTSCNFEWVRYLEDGSVNYIEGAKQPNYLVTADDVDTYLALEVQPLDNRKRKGELVKVLANEHRKITFDPEMQNHIEKTLHSGRASYKVSMSTRYLDIWEQAILEVKREACTIKCTGASGLVITEKFSPTTTVVIPYGTPTEFVITGSGEAQHILKVDDESDISRDTVVVILRLFIMRAGERRKAKKRSLFFSK